ncbi:hypothetical protein [Caenispirillum bisanense]|uniref:hypothetical protein n=1 Tax=Caenispirillum bisanense TaxID=414052 RepID=UPI0031E17421
MTLTRLLAAATAVAALSGCAVAPENCDPNQGNLFNTVGAMTSGCYDQRIANKQGELSRTQALTAELQASNATLTQQNATASLENAVAREDLATLEAERRKLEGDIARLQARTDAQRKQKQALEKRAAAVQADIGKAQQQAAANPGDAALQAEVVRLRQVRDALAAAVAAALAAQ